MVTPPRRGQLSTDDDATGREAHVPLPPRRPAELGVARNAPPAPSPQPPAPNSPEEYDACLGRLAALGVRASREISPASDNGACVIAQPVRLANIRPSDGPTIEFPAAPLLDCRLAEHLAQWLGGIVAPVMAARFGAPLRAVRTGQGYECRNRNREAQGKISAHASGLAIDIAGFELADGRVIGIGGGETKPPGVVQALRTAACGWFTTVLGPGSDAMHKDHLHLDVAPHGSNGNYRICE